MNNKLQSSWLSFISQVHQISGIDPQMKNDDVIVFDEVFQERNHISKFLDFISNQNSNFSVIQILRKDLLQFFHFESSCYKNDFLYIKQCESIDTYEIFTRKQLLDSQKTFVLEYAISDEVFHHLCLQYNLDILLFHDILCGYDVHSYVLLQKRKPF